ncbi:NXPE family member 3-like [Diadema setosum]|uniref:NXPE family member 3-like n=1 Tax=Diadema setosum TaxID=31175 RepID=UPI003B3B13B6
MEGSPTSASLSTYRILNRKDTYKVNDRLQVLIETKDEEGNPRKTGGDFFRGRLESRSIQAASRSDGEIVDFRNGSYLAEFVVRWPGTARVLVMLVDGAHAVIILDRMQREHLSRGRYLGTFKKGKIVERTPCNIVHVAPLEDECDFTHAETNVSWFCARPTNESLNCSHWWWHNSDGAKTDAVQSEFIESGEGIYFSNYKRYLPCNQCEINITSSAEGNNVTDEHGRFPWQEPWNDLPKCLPIGTEHHDHLTSGYYYNDSWVSTQCRNRRFAPADVVGCLANKTVLSIGDSTVRQVFETFNARMGLRLLPQYECMLNTRNEAANISLYYKFHGLPNRGHSGYLSTCIIRSASYVLDHLPFNPDVFILSITAHFTLSSLDYFTERMNMIRSAVERLHRRSPNTLFIIKATHTRRFSKLVHILANNEWMLYSMDRIVRRTFAHYPGVILVDAWDMTVSQLHKDNIHPDKRILSNIVDLILSYICPI